MKDALKKVRATARRHRKRCQRLSKEDPDHICSVDHVRIPPHCRLKRDHKKRVARVKNYTKLALTTANSNPMVSAHAKAIATADSTSLVRCQLPDMPTDTGGCKL